MDIKVVDQEAPPRTATTTATPLVEQLQPLLESAPVAGKVQKTPTQRAVRRTFKGTANLSNLLPTGSVLIFHFLSPILTNRGQCQTPNNELFTLGLLAFCSFSCFFLCFTDSIRDSRGKVRYGLATCKGLWIIDGSVHLPPEESANFRLRFIDFFHAFLTVLVFWAVALFDQNVVKCFYPEPSEKTKQTLIALPIWVGIICSSLFVAFPSKRHGVGFPLSNR